jgi:hypothetical protein
MVTFLGINPFFTEQYNAGRYDAVVPFGWTPQQVVDEIDSIIDERCKPGYRPGVLRITINPTGWKSRTVVVDENSVFQTTMEARVPGETPRKTTRVIVEKLPEAKLVEAILYNKSVLAEKDEPCSGAEWDLITILTHPTEVAAPMNVGTLLANHFGSDGGSNTLMNPEQFEKTLRESHDYWKDKGLAEVKTRAFRSVSLWARLKAAGINADVIADAYDWAIDVDGELHGLVAGDMGFEKTGIKLNEDDIKIWRLGVDRYLHSQKIDIG